MEAILGNLAGNVTLEMNKTMNGGEITDVGLSVTLPGLTDILQTTVNNDTKATDEKGSVLELSYSVIIPLAVIGGFLAILLFGYLMRWHCTSRRNNGNNRSSFFRSNITPNDWRSSTHSNQSTALLHRAHDGRQSATSTKSHWEYASKLNKISESPEIKHEKSNAYKPNKKTTPLNAPRECTCGAAQSEPPKTHRKVFQEHVNNSFIDSQSTLQSNNTITEFNKYALPKVNEEMQISSEPNLLNTGLDDNERTMKHGGRRYLQTYAKRPSYISGLPQFNPLLMKAISDCKLGSKSSMSSKRDLTDSNLEDSTSTKPQGSITELKAPSGARNTTNQCYSNGNRDRRIKRRSNVQLDSKIKRPNNGPLKIPPPAFEEPSFASNISYDSSKLTMNSASEVSLASNVGHWQYNQIYKDPSIPTQCRINDLSSIQILSESSNHESSHVSMYPSMGSFDLGTVNGSANNATNTDVSVETNYGSSNTSRLGSNENQLNIKPQERNTSRDHRTDAGSRMTSYSKQEEASHDSRDFHLPNSTNPFIRSKGQTDRRSQRVVPSPYAPRSCISSAADGDPPGDEMLINPRNLTLSTSLINSDSETVHNNTPTGLLNPSFSENISVISTSDAGFGKVEFLPNSVNRTPVNNPVNVASWAMYNSLPEKNGPTTRQGNYFMPPRTIFYKHWGNAINFDSPTSASSDSNTISIPVSPVKRSKPLKRSSFDPSQFHRQQDILRRSARSRRSHSQRIPLKTTEYWV